MNFFKKKIRFIFLIFLFFCNLNCADIGSDFTIQSHIIFDYDEENRIANDAVMENGFTLTARTAAISDVVATCSIDSYFSVKGFTSLNGGVLYLNNNITFDNTFALGSAGRIYGNGYTIEFPASYEIIGIPSSIDRGGRLDRYDLSFDSRTNSVAWSYDNKYMLFAENGPTGRIRVYSFDVCSLTLKDNVIISANIMNADWHPSSYFIAVADYTSKAIKIFLYDSGSLTLKSTTNLDYEPRVVRWSWDGKYLATATMAPNVEMYSFDESSGTILYITEKSFAGHGIPRNDSLSWDFNSYDFVISTTAEGADIILYSFDSSSLNVTTSIHISGSSNTNTVDWKKNSNLIAVGLSGTSENARIYKFENNQLIELICLTENVGVSKVRWNNNGHLLAIAKASNVGDEFETYFYDFNENKLYLLNRANATTGYGLNFSNLTNKYLGYGTEGNGGFFTFQQNWMLFDNTNLVFNSDTEFIVTTTFSGNCTINGNGNKVYLNEDGSLKIESGSKLTLKNLELVGLDQTNLQCLADDASIILEDCKLTITSDYTFDTGSILFKGDVVISGTNKFIYSPSCSSTIDSQSMLMIDNGVTFSYDPLVAKRDLLYMQDNTSWFYLDSCSLNSTKTGMRLTRGKLFIDNLVTLNAEGSAFSEAICFGNGTANDDLNIEILASANLDIYGKLEYKNTN